MKTKQISQLGLWMNKKDRESPDWALILPKYKLIYLETFKAACTKIRTLLILLNRGYDDHELAEFLLKNPQTPYYHWEFGIPDNQSVSREELSTLLDNGDFFKFAFVRNPYERLVSAYANKIFTPHLQGSEVYTYIAKKIKAETIWKPSGFISTSLTNLENKIKPTFLKRKDFLVKAEKPIKLQGINGSLTTLESYDYGRIIQKIKDSYHKLPPENIFERLYIKTKTLMFGYPDFNCIDLNENPVDFEEFIRFICEQTIDNMNPHWQPQTFYIGYDYIKYNFIGRVENFDLDIQYVFDKVGTPEFIYSYIKGKMNHSKKPENQTFWTDELAGMVYEKYKSDFEAFGYDKMSYKNY